MKRLAPGTAAPSSLQWLLSYADMATILLALFLVLAALSKDQTGVSLYQGTRSFGAPSRRLADVKLPGAEDPSSQQTPEPAYLAEELALPGPERGSTESNDEVEQLFLKLAQEHAVVRLPRLAGRLIVDVYQPLNDTSPCLQLKHLEMLERFVPLLARADYRLHLVVWAATPAPSAWIRASEQAQRTCEDFARASRLAPEAAGRLTGLGQPWRYRDIRRPTLSLILYRTE